MLTLGRDSFSSNGNLIEPIPELIVGDILVLGRLGDVFLGNFECTGKLIVEPGTNLNADYLSTTGGLAIGGGNVESGVVLVDGDVSVVENIVVHRRLHSKGSLVCTGSARSFGGQIRVSKSFKCDGEIFAVSDIVVGGHLESLRKIEAGFDIYVLGGGIRAQHSIKAYAGIWVAGDIDTPLVSCSYVKVAGRIHPRCYVDANRIYRDWKPSRAVRESDR